MQWLKAWLTIAALDCLNVFSSTWCLILDVLERRQLSRITLDFDGSVPGTCRHAEGVASGFNSKKKDHCNSYPLNCTVAQTEQILAVLSRKQNVHPSNRA